MKKILITGGSGFIGINLIKALVERDYDVVNIDIRNTQYSTQNIHYSKINLLDANELKSFFRDYNPQYVIHLAARTDLDGQKLEDYSVNSVGTKNLVEAISSVGTVERCIFTTSKLVCRPGYLPCNAEDYAPHTLYGESKVLSEKIIRQSDLPCTWCIGRPSSIWGPWFGVPYRDFFINVAKGRYWHPGGVNPPKSFGYVGNVIHQILSLLDAPKEKIHANTFYWSDYEATTIKGWADCISMKIRGEKTKEVPELLIKAIALGGDLLKKAGVSNPPLTSFRLRNIKTDTTTGVSLDAMKEISGPLPYTLEQGVNETVLWMRTQKLI